MADILSNDCGIYLPDFLQKMEAEFYRCSNFDYAVAGKKLKSTGFFGLFDNSNKTANAMMDMQYLNLYLQMIHYEKLNDAINCSSACKVSKHPRYYINTYQLDCIFEYFKCNNIDISCQLKAYYMDKLYYLPYNDLIVEMDTEVPYIELLDTTGLKSCPEIEVEIPDPEEVYYCSSYCFTPPFGLNAPTFTLQGGGSTIWTPGMSFQQFLTNIATVLGPNYTIAVTNIDDYCIRITTTVVVRTITIDYSVTEIIDELIFGDCPLIDCCIEYFPTKESDWLYEQLLVWTDCDTSLCEIQYVFRLSESETVFTHRIEENICEPFYTFRLDEEIC